MNDKRDPNTQRKGQEKSRQCDNGNRGHTMGQSYFIKESRSTVELKAMNRKQKCSHEAGGRQAGPTPQKALWSLVPFATAQGIYLILFFGAGIQSSEIQPKTKRQRSPPRGMYIIVGQMI